MKRSPKEINEEKKSLIEKSFEKVEKILIEKEEAPKKTSLIETLIQAIHNYRLDNKERALIMTDQAFHLDKNDMRHTALRVMVKQKIYSIVSKIAASTKPIPHSSQLSLL